MSLEQMALPFRSGFLKYDELTRQARAWADAFPDVVKLESIGRSVEGRELWLLSIGGMKDRACPAVWVDANMHASELSGSSVALAIAEDVIRLHLDDTPAHGLNAQVHKALRDVRFFVLPRMSPDGAEAVLTTGRYVRSNPRDRRLNRPPRWVAGDLDGDGLALMMRVRDPGGDFVASAAAANLMVPRLIDDEGPFYRLYPEGRIEPFDGTTIPDANYLADNDTDLNRNFPWGWMPEPTQNGAGAFPTSEPETRAVVEFTSAHPEIFAWLNFHTFGGVLIRPLGHAPDSKMEALDLAIYRQIEAWSDELTGYPTVSGFEEFLYQPDKPLHGELTDFAYHARGCISYVTELWDLFKQLGLSRRKPFVDHYSHMTRADLVTLARWDRDHNKGRVFRPWRAFHHSQLGDVELGGVDIRVGLSNPPYEMLGDLCSRHTALSLRVAAMAPRVAVTPARLARSGGLTRVEITVRNDGYLPTYVLASAKERPFNEPLVAEATVEGCKLVGEMQSRQPIGHLEGWGRGLFAGFTAPFHQRSKGSSHRRTLQWVLEGTGRLNVRVGSCRVGWFTTSVEIP